jgi:hypothetical protein
MPIRKPSANYRCNIKFYATLHVEMIENERTTSSVSTATNHEDVLNKYNDNKSDNTLSIPSHVPEVYSPKRCEENCGFAVHVLMVVLSILYTSYIVSIYCFVPSSLQLISNDYDATTTNHNRKNPSALTNTSNLQLQQNPHFQHTPLWTIMVPFVIMVLFFSIMIVYGTCINRNTTHHPKYGRLFNIQDTQTIKPPFVSPLTQHPQQLKLSQTDCNSTEQQSSLQPPLHSMYRYYQNPMTWTPSTNNDDNSTTFTTYAVGRIPNICDIDVADINDLVWNRNICVQSKKSTSL